LALINTIDVIVWEVEVRTFMFTYVSSQAEKLLGYPITNWITEPTFWADHIHPDDREWAINFCSQSTKKKGTYSFEYRMIAADNRIVWLRDVVTVIVENGQPKQLRGILMDVTESRELQESLQKAEERYRSIFENAAEGIYQSTPDGKLLTANPSLAKIFGFTSTEELIHSVTDIGSQIYVNGHERQQIKNLIEKDGKAFGIEFQSVKKNGEIIWVRDHVRAIYDKNKRVKYYEGTLEDITERKLAEDRLRAKLEEVQKTNYELDHFVYSVSHDLRSPVATIQGLVNIAEKETLSAASQKYLEMIRESINRMEGFIKDILTYSRNSRLELTIEKINFRELLTSTQSSLKLLQGADRLKIELEMDDHDAFYSDSARVAVILKNMIANSIRYQDRNKESFLNIHVATSSESVLITFTDNGIGIESSLKGKIFDMFYRASDISTGAGLGLYIAKEIIGKLGGSIEVQSALGVFTTFEVCIPNLSTHKQEASVETWVQN
jgi:PAS domain S-box-containing protein